MAEVKNAFIKSKMNKDLDSRLLPSGEYRDGRNIQVSKSEGEDVGALENALGNTLAVDFNALQPDAGNLLKTIGLLSDPTSSTIVVFLTNNNKSSYQKNAKNYIYSYQANNSGSTTALVASGAFLNFSQQNPIYGINLLEDLLFWTDNRNQPRVLNIEKAISNSSFYNSEDLISVAKYNPYQAIDLYYQSADNALYYSSLKDVVSSFLPDGTTPNPFKNLKWPGDPDYLENRFVTFSYRFKFDDGEYSIMAPFTQEAFIPKQDGYFLPGDEDDAYRSTIVRFMENKVNSVELFIPLPFNGTDMVSKLNVIAIDILYKESDSLSVKVLESLSTNEIAATTTSTFKYDYQSRKPYKTLPESEIIRVYDKVPVKALGQEIISNRVVYSNFQDKHTPPSFIDYDIAVTPKSSFSVNPNESPSTWTTSIVEYPEHTVKQNRNYQVGFVLSDRYGRQSTTILSNISAGTRLDEDGVIYGGSTFYHAYEPDPDSFVPSRDNVANNWPGDSLKILVNEKIVDESTEGFPGLYNGDVNSDEYKPLGWYSYKVVVKQTEQEYYNVYLPGILNGYPNVGQSVPPTVPNPVPDPQDTIAHITLIGDNINKVPRNLTEVGPEQKQYGSEVQLSGRVTPNRSTTPLDTIPYYPQINSQSVVTISEQNNLFDSTATPPASPNFATIYQTETNPYVARVSQGDVEFTAAVSPTTAPLPIGSLQAATVATDYKILLGVFETAPVESLIDIFYETSTSGLISELNSIAGTDFTPNGFQYFDNGYWTEASGVGTNITETNFIPTFNEGNIIEPLRESVVTILSITRNGQNAARFFSNIIDGGRSVNGDQTWRIEVAETILFSSEPIENEFIFTFKITNGETQGGDPTNIESLSATLTLSNVAPTIDPLTQGGVEVNKLVIGPRTESELQNPFYDFDGNNGFIKAPNPNTLPGDNQTGLVWSIKNQFPLAPTITIDPVTGEIYEKTGSIAGNYSFIVVLKDTSGVSPISLNEEKNIEVIFGQEEINPDFGSYTKENEEFSIGLHSAGLYWGDYSNNSLVESSASVGEAKGLIADGEAPVSWNTKAALGPIGDPVTSIGLTLPLNGLALPSTLESFKVTDRFQDKPSSNYYIWKNSNYKSKYFDGGASATDSSLKIGTAYVKVDFIYNGFKDSTNYQEDEVTQIVRSEQIGASWLAYLQYRENTNSIWETALDIENKEIRFGSTQANRINYPSNTSQNTFVKKGLLLNSTEGLNVKKDNRDDTEPEDWATAAAPWIGGINATGPKPGSVVSHVFAFGKSQSYTNLNNKFGEYRLLVKYPYSSAANPLNQIIPNQLGSGVAEWVENGAQEARQELKVNVNFGDFYYPESNSDYFYQYQVGIGYSTANEVFPPNGTSFVYAREWSLKYVSQFYTDSTLLTKWEPSQVSGNFHSYRSVSPNDQDQVPNSTKQGTNNSNVVKLGNPTPTAFELAQGDVYSDSNRFFIAQFDATGKKIAGTAQPSYGSFN